ncbi:MAG TPA: glycoside hydrolase family 6 protein [Candidatus Limnocylindrales bacterium]|nr:glycoside hydrolase family 6 protein [Candidatus Limnocylindrales bacterium]
MHSKSITDAVSQRVIGAVAAVAFSLTACNSNEPSNPDIRSQVEPTASAEAHVPECPTSAEFNAGIDADDVPFYRPAKDATYEKLQEMIRSDAYDPIDCQLGRLQQMPQADWVGDWTGGPEQTRNQVRSITQAAKQSNTIPLFVGYNIPNRDVGQYSAGGAAEAKEYMAWTKGFSEGIGKDPAVVIWEPDAVSHAADLPQQAQKNRFMLLRTALGQFKAQNPNASMYLDAGNDNWLPPDRQARLLRSVDGGTGVVSGISVNVSNYGSPESSAKYGQRIAAAFGRPLDMLVDTSRSGAPVPDRQNFCNNPHARLGELRRPGFDADETVTYAFVKRPLESDGDCGPDHPPAGQPHPEFLARLLGLTHPVTS